MTYKKSTYIRAARTTRQRYEAGYRYLRHHAGCYMPYDEPHALRSARIAIWTVFQDWFGFDLTEQIFASWEWSHRSGEYVPPVIVRKLRQ